MGKGYLIDTNAVIDYLAATSAVYKLKLVTRNISDFEKLPGIKLVNPHDI